MDWQPIETAPKDGTAILLGYFHENLDGSIYQEGGAPIVGRWIPTRKTAEDGAAINWVAHRSRLRSNKTFSPTHWMPLPEPPGTAILEAMQEHSPAQREKRLEYIKGEG